jgi:hypothetical protein
MSLLFIWRMPAGHLARRMAAHADTVMFVIVGPYLRMKQGSVEFDST